MLSSSGSRFILPIGTTREDNEESEEVTIPPARPVPPRVGERLISVSELDNLAKGSFPGYKSLNRIQSVVYPTAYSTNENMLVCAPTGAGKTDVAVLTILRVLSQYLNGDVSLIKPAMMSASIRRDDFKIIYIAPMKALAAEIVRKIGRRLAWLNIKVRELTGDMQMTRAEIAETQMIVTTPEKWDVVTRKSTGEGELASKVRLLIIDEVHLLNEERGAVIETIVARTLRQVESSQSLIRIVGLSATLPNYIDVADFLHVSRYTGLFFFDSSFRPVPLEQHFLGVKGKPNSPQSKKNLDAVVFKKVSELVKEGHQVMVFVHARKETVKSAEAIREAALLEGNLDDFDISDHPQYDSFRREIGTSRNKEMKQLFDRGFGIHHAGMLRSDRNMMEKMFEARAIKVLCCTATLAWGVNLPAHAVIIKGTQVYDSGQGSFVDLSVLDVLQIFGRAGRPGMESSGVGYIATTQDKLDHYLDAITAQVHQHPIESKFTVGMIDSLNAEISLGTVSNVTEAVQWVGYTYLFVRMRRNPMVYGMSHEEPAEDPQLGNRRNLLVTSAARKLADARMIQFHEATGVFTITDLGRIAAKYYIRYNSIEIFNKEFRPVMSEADVLAMLSMSTEFDQIQVRENEIPELKHLMDEIIPCQVKGGTDTSQGKVNILLQGYISRAYIEDFALVSDTAYAAQNGGRIIRALLEIAISKKWAGASAVLMSMSKAVEMKMWPYQHPLAQFDLGQELLYNLQRWADELPVSDLVTQTAAELGELVHMNERHGAALLRAAKQLPSAAISYAVKPLSSDLLRIAVTVNKAFEWSSKVHGSTEFFWLWVEDHEGVDILQWHHLLFHQATEILDVDFTIPIVGSKLPPSVCIRFISDKWLGAEHEILIDLSEVVLPMTLNAHTDLLDVPLLSASAIQDSALARSYSQLITNFNAIQTQCFWPTVHTQHNVLLCGPTACGKSTLASLGIWQALRTAPTSDVIVITPEHTSARHTVLALKPYAQVSGARLNRIDTAADLTGSAKGSIQVISAEVLIAVLSNTVLENWLSRISLVVLEDLDALDASYELSVASILHASLSQRIRIVATSASLNDPSTLGDWLNVYPQFAHSFLPSDRDTPLDITTQTFTIPHSAALMKAMIKPAYGVARSIPPGGNAIFVVPSRAQCYSVAADLVKQCTIEFDTQGFLGSGLTSEDIQPVLTRLRNANLGDALALGIGIYHEALPLSDKRLLMGFYADRTVRVLVVPRERCWTLPVRASSVIILGAQYLYIRGDGAERQVRDYTVRELVRMQGLAVQHGVAGRMHLMCQAEQRDTYVRFLQRGQPLESALLEDEGREMFYRWFARKRKAGSVKSKQDAMDLLSWTFLARRLGSNPSYYGASKEGRDGVLSRLVDDAWKWNPETANSNLPVPLAPVASPPASNAIILETKLA
ncbi:Sec63-domain-containing protein [Dacryopinax primogenitus]|uniref:Sec63-domain-containing protein n=1 Tax=Dacryopinax primogenitus (strain DJM 731) TaxID=1858805 RepID=M5GBW6_DACPD|nr:Sec63-domain-containing protein [Dacryopinax primogenitus]EJU06494.1 Sec63-domain-containing protein [Dacryopinax primogenitus]